MGHHTETYFVHTSQAQNAQQALNAALDMDRDEHGYHHNPRAGHIILLDPKTSNEAWDDDSVMRSRRDGAFWDPPTIVTPIYSDDSVSRRTITKTLTFTGEEWGSNNSRDSYSRWEKIRAAVAGLVTLREGERIETVKAHYDESQGSTYGMRNDSYITRTSKVVTKSTEGKAVTRYFVAVDTSNPTHKAMWQQGFESQALARKAMEKHIKERDNLDHAEIVAVTRREDGSPLVTTTREVSKVKVSVKVTIAKIKANPQISGHRVSFDVHS